MSTFTQFSVAVAALFLSAAASAQTFTPQGTVIDASSAPFATNGVGSAATVWDIEQQRFIMFFETRLTDATASCPAGQWGIGVASSEDGVAWDTYPTLAVAPTPGTFHSCYAVQPAVVKDDFGDYHLWFQAGQGADACASSTPSWGCQQALGLGHVQGIVELDDKSAEIALLTQQVTALEAQKDAFTAAWATELVMLRNDLEAALECVANTTFCAPCFTFDEQIVYNGGKITYDFPLCQTMSFDPPPVLPVSMGVAGPPGNAVLRFGLGNLNGGTCRYKGNNSSDDFERVVGNCPATSGAVNQIQLEVSNARTTPLVFDVVITDNGLFPQSFTGGGVTTLDALINALNTGDDTTVPTFTALLDGQLFLLIVQTDPADAIANAARAANTARLSQFNALVGQLNAAQAALDAAESYEQEVSLFSMLDQPVLIAARAGFPSVVLKDGQFEMVYSRGGNLYRGFSFDGFDWTFDDVNPVLARGVTPWAQDEIFSPSLLCEADGSVTNFFGGRITNLGIPGASINAGAIGRASSSTMLSWAVDALLETFSGNDAYRHLEVVRANSSYRMYYTDRDSLGRTRINLSTDGGSFTPANTATRVCN